MSARRASRGFALIELILAISIAAILSIYANRIAVEQSYESIARAGAEYLRTVLGAVESHVMDNRADYEAGNNVPGVANDLRPTLAEMIALGRLRAGFPAVMPTRQTVRIDITRTNCPGPTCILQTTVCTTTPLTFDGVNIRHDLVTAMYEELEGRGGISSLLDPANIRGAAVNTPNPNGNVAGINCATTNTNIGIWSQFVRIQDNRDPDLQGNLTVAGNVAVGGTTQLNQTLNVAGATTLQNNLTVQGAATVGPCINLQGGAQGRAAFGCENPADVPAGYTGGVRSQDVVADGNILVSSAPGTFTGANTNYALMTANNGTGAAEVRTSGRVAANRLTPQGTFASGAACAAADEGSIARLAGGPGLVTCISGAWRVFNFQAAAGDACAPNGATARDATGRELLCLNGTFQPFDQIFRTATPDTACTTLGATAFDTTNANETLICRVNLAGGTGRWMRLRDVTQHLVFVRALEVAPNQVVTKPVCNQAASTTVQQIIQLIPKVWGTPDGGQAFFAQDNGATWTVRMRDGVGNNLQGTPNAAAIAQIYCYFP